MKMLARLLGLLSAGLAAVVARPVNTYQGFMVKSTATAQTPALTVLGALAAALGVMPPLAIRHDHRSCSAQVSARTTSPE